MYVKPLLTRLPHRTLRFMVDEERLSDADRVAISGRDIRLPTHTALFDFLGPVT